MKITLLFMNAGSGSRFGGGIRQLEPMGKHGEIIMDYSIHDAIKAGLNKLIFIIRKDIEEGFREVVGNQIEKICTNLGVGSGNPGSIKFDDLENVLADVIPPIPPQL